MLFKKKVPVEEYCRQNLTTVFSKEREATWETLRRACNDNPLSQVDEQLYYRHLRAVFIQLMLSGITKNCSMNASSDAHVFVMLYLEEHGHPEIHEISRDYNQAFASSGLAPNRDGVAEMVAHFADVLTPYAQHSAATDSHLAWHFDCHGYRHVIGFGHLPRRPLSLGPSGLAGKTNEPKVIER